jgi:hypothetical protein
VATIERCHFCSEDLPDDHRHVARLDHQELACACRACALLFTSRGAAGGKYLTVPDDWRRYAGVVDQLPMPVDLGFFFWNSAQARVVGVYPGPAGPTETGLELDLDLSAVQPDVEAVLVRGGEAWVVPIDACYRLVGVLRSVWQGFSGGPDARRAVDEFVASVRTKGAR